MAREQPQKEGRDNCRDLAEEHNKGSRVLVSISEIASSKLDASNEDSGGNSEK